MKERHKHKTWHIKFPEENREGKLGDIDSGQHCLIRDIKSTNNKSEMRPVGLQQSESSLQ